MTEPFEIEQAIRDEMQISQYQVVSRFYSRRNQVYRMNGIKSDNSYVDFVYKFYISGDSEKEFYYLNRLKGNSVPKVLGKGANGLSLEYIDGPLLIEKQEEAEKANTPFEPYLDMLIDFLARFYKALPGIIYGDINLRNFIITQNGLYGIDLEEAKPGKIETDIGRTAAYLLTYDPANTPYKKEMTDYFIQRSAKRLSISRQDILDEMNRELDYMKVRRQLRIEKTNTEGYAVDSNSIRPFGL